MDLKQILETTSLPILSASHPEMWSDIFADLKSRVSSGQSATLGTLRNENIIVLDKWRKSDASPLAASEHAKSVVLRAKMTVLAIDQFADAFTGKVGRPPSFKDRIVFQSTIGKLLTQKKCPSMKDFDRSWSWIHDKVWASAEIQRRGFWSVPTKEFVARVKEHASGRPILELGGGLGFLANALTEAGVAVRSCDDYSWNETDGVESESSAVVKMDALTALKTVKPSFVICSWPPPGNNFEEKIFTTPSVQVYFAIVSQHRFASGNWLAYQRQSQFTCTSSGPLNQLLRPLEAEQQVLIFRRR